jgi:hypothetical protein
MKSAKISIGSATPNQNFAAKEVRGFIVGIGFRRPNVPVEARGWRRVAPEQ